MYVRSTVYGVDRGDDVRTVMMSGTDVRDDVRRCARVDDVR